MKYLLTIIILGALLAAPLLHRAPAQAGVEPVPAEARLLFVGDLMLGRFVGASMQAHGYDAPFAPVKGFLSSPDLTIGNLEGPLVPSDAFSLPVPSANQPLLTGDSRSAGALARAGFDILSLANNHSYDAGSAGLQATASALESASITPLGLDSGGQVPVVRDVAGLRIAFLAYTTVLNYRAPGVAYIDPISQADIDKLSHEVSGARQEADVVVVVMHWGTEYSTQPNDTQRQLASIISRAGADLIVGSHPHVGQGMELLGGDIRPTLVAYSLGNALFDQAGSTATKQGLALECVVDRDGVKSARLVPLAISTGANGYTMGLADDASGQSTLRQAATSTPASLQWAAIWDAGLSTPGLALAYYRSRKSGVISSLEDLGTGKPTRVDLRDGALSVSEETSPNNWQNVWSTDSAWYVTGYTVGDADADGRPELIYTLWKPRLTWERPPTGGMRVNMQGGEVLPHIYINGWRQGAMQPVWQGSPRPAPVLSVAVAPIGEQGKPLLAILESSSPAKEQAPGDIRVWQWTDGFGYELVSPVQGTYSQMWTDGRILIFK